ATATPTPTPTPSQLTQVPEAQHGASPFPSPSPAGEAAYNLASDVVQAGAGNETARGAIDGDVYTEWNARQGVGPSTWITIDLGTSETVSRVDLLPDASPDALCYFNIQTSSDGNQWTTIAQDAHGLGSNSAPAWASVKFTATNARYVRIQPTDWGARSWVAVWEIKLYP
ncbi:MAG TPA: discoidin domain-containing protein, partial [Oscillatoriaceae cyanobacterium]